MNRVSARRSGLVAVAAIAISIPAVVSWVGPAVGAEPHGTVSHPVSHGAQAKPYRYRIVDLGAVGDDTQAQGEAGSPNGLAAGNSYGTGPTSVFSWSSSGGLVGLPSAPGRPWTKVGGINDAGTVVGTSATTSFGSDPRPMIWQDSVRKRLPLPHGLAYGRAYSVNDSGMVAGSAGGSGLSYDLCTLYNGTKTTVIRQTLPDGSYCSEAFGINDAGRVVGIGIDPNNPARNVAFVIDTATKTTYTLGGTKGRNGAIAFGVSEAGQVVGSSMQDQGDGVPFIWTESTGMVQIPLPKGTSSGEARGVNSAGWVVGYAASAYSIPFVYDGTHTYRLADLLPAGSGWDLSKNTSSAAMSISEDGVIIGTGVRDGQVRAFAMIPRTKG
jgi:uncharacterized membrane protein